MDDRVPAVDAPHRGADANNEQTPLLVQKAEQGHKGAGDSSKPVEQKKGDALRKPNQHFPLLTYDESLKEVPWQTDNAYIQTGYRRHMSTVGLCLWSAIAYFHNETVNIHTHSVGAAFFAALIPLHLLPINFPCLAPFLPHPKTWWGAHDPLPVPPTIEDKIAMTAYLVCAVSCLGLSSWFHTVQCGSRERCNSANRGDYLGIVILIVGSILPGMYYAFPDQLFWRYFYMGLVSTFGFGATWMVLSPYGRTHRWHRTLTFIALGLSSVIPIAHVTFSRGLTYARNSASLDLIVAGGLSYIVGAVLYAARFPERLLPGKVDYMGNSHQIFHTFVLVGAWFQYAALRGMVWGRAMALGQA